MFDLAWSHDGKHLATTDYSGASVRLYSCLNGIPTFIKGTLVDAYPTAVVWAPDDTYLVVARDELFGANANVYVFPVIYLVDNSIPNVSNSIIFGNSAQGSASDLAVYVLSGAYIDLNGFLFHDAA